MPVEKTDGGIVFTGPDGISLFMLIQIKGVLKLELKGIKVWKRSAMFNLAAMGAISEKRQYTKKDREETLKALTDYLDSLKSKG